MGETIYLALFVVYADALMLFFIFRLWRKRRVKNPDFSLRFRIVDIWAATLGLTPSIVLLTGMLRGPATNIEHLPIVAALLIPHQLAGILYMFLVDERPENAQRRGAFSAFVVVLGGAIVGFLAPVYAFLLAAFVLYIGALLYALFPLSLIFIVLFVALYTRPRKPAESPPPSPQARE